MLHRVKVIVVVLVVGVIVGVAVWQLMGPRVTDDGVHDELGLRTYEGRLGIPLPSLQGRSLDDQKLNVEDMRGDVLVINIWGSWCTPCRAEATDLAAIANETHRQGGVRFLGINVRDNPAAAEVFTREYDIPYPSLDDQGGRLLAQLSGIIPIRAVPSTLVVDSDGIIRARVVGRVEEATLRRLIRESESSELRAAPSP